MLVRKKKTKSVKKFKIYYRKSNSITTTTKKVASSYSYRPRTPQEIQQEKDRQEALKQEAEDKKDELVSLYGEPNCYIVGQYYNSYYWFDLGFKLKGCTLYNLKLKKKYWLFGEENVYCEYTNYKEPEDTEVQIAYKWFNAENILLE